MSCDFQPPSRTFGPAPPPFRLFLATTHLSLVAKSPVVHPLSVQLLTKCSSRNSFVLKTIHLSWVGCTPGVYPPPQSLYSSSLQGFRRASDLSPFFSHSCALCCAFLHSEKNATLFFLSESALFAKKHAGVEVPPPSAGNAERMDRAGQARLSVRIENYDLIWLEAGSQVTAAWRK